MDGSARSPQHPAPESDPVYFALTGDVVSSRELQDRAGVQRALRRVVEELNHQLAGFLATPLEIIAGDEVQGLLFDPRATVDVVTRVADRLHPVRLAWGLGRGSITTDWAEDVSLLDGPCLHRARDAVEVATSEGRWLVARGFEPPHGTVLSTLFDLTWTVRASWTDTQMKYVREARKRKQTEVAEIYEVSRQAVSKALDSAEFSVILEGEEAARRYLAWLGSSPGPDRTEA